MPIHDSNRIEFAIESGNIHISSGAGEALPAYWAHPVSGDTFPGIALLHDWWGLTNVQRLLANFYAHLGFYVIVPDMFNGELATKPQQALRLMTETEKTRYKVVETTLNVLEKHHRTNGHTAIIGTGMGGSLAFEAAIKRRDLEAAVAYGGFPQRYWKGFDRCTTPILAMYGSEEPYIKQDDMDRLRKVLKRSLRHDDHQLIVVPGAAHNFFSESSTPESRDTGKDVINMTLAFLEKYIERPDLSQYAQF
ncbi:MAG: dienelactone hydrolase family protein [Anaerolineae bacterium]|nr:dienelactone hydrolase family protein [Anaerolineae bacterium]MCA9887669.1 dienelactone hydrolase family protein [Anaerolineae bacterium]MCA9895167.1 dienelactone hydrolase family protein [Anaerolineae bacterium]MCB9459039.1 dienelactone hydrolase family protein [Anaerolineaceae bacterium]